jgi:hypothetical protein
MIDSSNSSFQHLISNLLNSIDRVAPEKAIVLRQLIHDNGITFEIDRNSLDLVFFASSATSTITFGLRSLELLWARAFAYCSLYELLTSRLLDGEDVFDVDLTHTTIQPAMELLSWAVATELQIRDGVITDFEWPSDLPKYSRDADRSTFENAADELLLVAVAAILHHEIGHIVRDHDAGTLDVDKYGDLTPSSRETSLRWEKDADAWAAEWLLGGLENDDERFLKRVLGLSLAFTWLATRNVHTGHWLSSTHPPAWDRIYHNIKQHIPNTPHHPIWAFIGYILQLHLMSVSAQTEIHEAETHEDWVNKLLDYVSRL